MATRALVWRVRRLVLLLACVPLPAAHLHASQEEGEAFWAGPAMSGSWFSTARSGEGVILQVLDDGSAVAFWFTYPAPGEAGEQAWLVGQGGVLDGDRVRFEQVYRPQGARFGDAFDPAEVAVSDWGSLQLRFLDCHTAELTYEGPPGFGSGTRELVRLTELDQLGCSGTRSLLGNGAPAAAGLRARSGAWFVPERAGEGWVIEELAGGLVAVYWFTFAPDGEQAWILGLGTRVGEHVLIEAQITRGTRFGDGFDAAAVERLPWGTLELAYGDCGHLEVAYRSVLSGFGSATRSAERLVSVASSPCLDALPAALDQGSFQEHARMPSDWQSELAVAGADGALYALGGFGGPRSFKRYDIAADRWSLLPDLPAGRHHLSAFALGGFVYMAGGFPTGGGEQSVAAFRFDPATARWEALPELGFTEGSHAAVLGGRAYVGDGSGVLREYDPVNRRVRLLPRAPERRDHSQLVAFLGELWLLGGRSPETAGVAIWNPASNRWRQGPPMRARRGGFAAAVVGERIVVGGGEVIFTGFYIEPSTEIYSAGSDGWLRGPDLPEPVHGADASGEGGRWWIVGGSNIAGSRAGATGRLYSLRLAEPAR